MTSQVLDCVTNQRNTDSLFKDKGFLGLASCVLNPVVIGGFHQMANKAESGLMSRRLNVSATIGESNDISVAPTWVPFGVYLRKH